MERPIRKQIRLKDFDYSQGGAYFITICTHEHAHLFGEIIGDEHVGAHLCVRPHEPDGMVETWLYELERRFEGVVLDCYVIMPNHIHFVIRKEKDSGAHTGAPLPEIVKWFKTQTTNAYIRAVKAGLYAPFDGHLWQRNYYEHVIRHEQELQEIRSYILNNPGKWMEDKYNI